MFNNSIMITHWELTKRLGMVVRADRPYPKKHRKFLTDLKDVIYYILMRYEKDPQKTVKEIASEYSGDNRPL